MGRPADSETLQTLKPLIPTSGFGREADLDSGDRTGAFSFPTSSSLPSLPPSFSPSLYTTSPCLPIRRDLGQEKDTAQTWTFFCLLSSFLPMPCLSSSSPFCEFFVSCISFNICMPPCLYAMHACLLGGHTTTTKEWRRTGRRVGGQEGHFCTFWAGRQALSS